MILLMILSVHTIITKALEGGGLRVKGREEGGVMQGHEPRNEDSTYSGKSQETDASLEPPEHLSTS